MTQGNDCTSPESLLTLLKERRSIRREMDKHVKNTYLKKVRAPIGVKSTLLAWMELV